MTKIFKDKIKNKMLNERTHQDLKSIPVAEKNQKYIYIMENIEHKFKIGITEDINKRYHSLCGSNSQGNKIIKVYCSPATYMYITFENIMDTIFDGYRIPNTEWFYDDYDILEFEDIVYRLEELFNNPSYEKLNKLRQNYPYHSRKAVLC